MILIKISSKIEKLIFSSKKILYRKNKNFYQIINIEKNLEFTEGVLQFNKCRDK